MLSQNSRDSSALWNHNLSATPSNGQLGTRLTAHATIHTKGSWATLLTTTYDSYGFYLCVSNTASSGAQTDILLDIATGAAQEDVIVPNFPCGHRNTVNGNVMVQYFPILIPKGTLVSARIQGLITVDTADVAIFTIEGASSVRGSRLFSRCDAYGINLAASQGTSHTPGNSGAESTAANIGSVTSRPYGAVALGLNGVMGNTMNLIAYHWELVVGSTTICEWYSCDATTENVVGPFPPEPFHVSIPANTQLKIRAEASGTAQAHDVAFYCFY